MQLLWLGQLLLKLKVLKLCGFRSCFVILFLKFLKAGLPFVRFAQEYLECGAYWFVVAETNRGYTFVFKAFELSWVNLEQNSIGITRNPHLP